MHAGEVVLVVSVWRKGDWSPVKGTDTKPLYEELFTHLIADVRDQNQVSDGMASCIKQAKVWLKELEAGLWNHVVVTIYSLENL